MYTFRILSLLLCNSLFPEINTIHLFNLRQKFLDTILKAEGDTYEVVLRNFNTRKLCMNTHNRFQSYVNHRNDFFKDTNTVTS